MPKIIDNIKENLISETREQIRKFGYAGTTVRSVSKACGLGVGTVYNYFKSKENLIHAVMYEDWLKSVAIIEECSNNMPTPEIILNCIYDEINRFIIDHQLLLSDPNASTVFATAYAKGHKYLREQLSGYLIDTCKKYAKEPNRLLPEFIAEAILVWCAAGNSFDEIYSVLKPLFKEGCTSVSLSAE